MHDRTYPSSAGLRRVRPLAVLLLVLAMAAAVFGGRAAASGPATNTAAAHPAAAAASSLPCDIYAAGGTPCIAAHSTTRALFAAYSGPLYQVQRSSDHSYKDIGLLSAGGYADGASQVSFCSGTTCTITKIYDQTSKHNDLPISSGGLWKGPGPNGSDIGANASALPITAAGHQVYGVKVTSGVGYRVDHAAGAPTGSQPEGIYMVTSSNLTNQWCCFDYGSGENSHTDTGNATMNAIYWGNACWFGGCVGTGPWVEADLENGMYHTGTGSNKDPNNQGVHYPFVSAWEKNNGTSNFTLKYGNAASGSLTTTYSGALPKGYSPMKTDSSLLLGTGGDNSNSDQGEFFEGAITAGYPTDATENAVQAAITAAGYGSTTGPNTISVTNPGTQSATTGTAIAGLQIQATDSASGQTLTYSASGLPAGLSISSSGQITGTPTTAGTYSVIVTATDSTGATGTASFTWNVSGSTTTGGTTTGGTTTGGTTTGGTTTGGTTTGGTTTGGTTTGGTTTGGTGGGTCHVAYTRTSEWPGGFTADVTVSNTGTAAVNGWSVGFSMPGDQKITNGWNATVTQSGQAVTAVNMSYNSTIAAGGSTSFGFQGTFTSNDASPTAFTLNGAACS
ncbi:arabinofuranosidase catalytic domain-containing protein [Streptomyces sp. HPF1205]|uniref:arabinofuranosidase catalytic domain-containing protein n=1 Tax=Streptomyces sp. HPF1205 TaxID=2873262 RepID=UPI0027E0797B|nr:arabinofuranosidase catalytic domain-containing protein [Streptomyces sp. HPF1205]